MGVGGCRPGDGVQRQTENWSAPSEGEAPDSGSTVAGAAHTGMPSFWLDETGARRGPGGGAAPSGNAAPPGTAIGRRALMMVVSSRVQQPKLAQVRWTARMANGPAISSRERSPRPCAPISPFDRREDSRDDRRRAAMPDARASRARPPPTAPSSSGAKSPARRTRSQQPTHCGTEPADQSRPIARPSVSGGIAERGRGGRGRSRATGQHRPALDHRIGEQGVRSSPPVDVGAVDAAGRDRRRDRLDDAGTGRPPCRGLVQATTAARPL